MAAEKSNGMAHISIWISVDAVAPLHDNNDGAVVWTKSQYIRDREIRYMGQHERSTNF